MDVIGSNPIPCREFLSEATGVAVGALLAPRLHREKGVTINSTSGRKNA